MLLNGFSSDLRIGSSHMNVSGRRWKVRLWRDCFPKDVNAILSFLKKHGIN